MGNNFHKTLINASIRVSKWPIWKQKMLGMTATELHEYYTNIYQGDINEKSVKEKALS